MNTQIFIPKENTEIFRFEVDLEETFKVTEKTFQNDKSGQLYSWKGYNISLDNPRYHVFNHNRRCKCCDIAITNAFIEYSEQNNCYLINFYAQSKNKAEEDKEYYVLMVNNKEHGTLCMLCSFALAELNCSINQLQHSLFNCYRIYKNTTALRKADGKLLAKIDKINGLEKTIANIDAGMSKTNNKDTKRKMAEKSNNSFLEIIRLKKEVKDSRLQAQKTGNGDI